LAEKENKDRKFTPEELAAHNGAGRPGYVAFRGKVYDVSESPLWEGGEHMGAHKAGGDLTGEFEEAPHGEEVFERYPQVGVIREEEDAPEVPEAPLTPARQFWLRQIKRVPLLRRHPHPMLVHFPIAFMIATTAFTLLYVFTGVRSFEVTGWHCLAGGVLFTPVVMLTGWLTWWLNYESRWLKPVIVKISLSPLLLMLGTGLWLWRWFDPEILTSLQDWPSVLYLALICLLTPLVSIIGLCGAGLTFPIHPE
jgi:predicted heme/steroid binding protein/uncharacterized membrane protein